MTTEQWRLFKLISVVVLLILALTRQYYKNKNRDEK